MPTFLHELASTIRSKNAGVGLITFDVIMRDRPSFERVRNSGSLTPETIAALFRIDPDRITYFGNFEPALAIKFTIRRDRPSGSPVITTSTVRSSMRPKSGWLCPDYGESFF